MLLLPIRRRHLQQKELPHRIGWIFLFLLKCIPSKVGIGEKEKNKLALRTMVAHELYKSIFTFCLGAGC
jgi:hypothetical protein